MSTTYTVNHINEGTHLRPIDEKSGDSGSKGKSGDDPDQSRQGRDSQEEGLIDNVS